MPSGRQDGPAGLKGKRPRPLKLQADANGYEPEPTPASAEDTIRLMHQINQAVKAGSLTSNLASQIFRLYNELRQNGEYLEQTHKDELGRVFLSLRQACCRDSGQLGTPCRLKIMELIELRAMGWRTNLAHSQYYMARGQESDASGYGVNEYGPVPVSAPPFGAIPVNPFGLGFQQQQNAMPQAVAPQPDAYDIGSPAGLPTAAAAANQPQFYIIPASNVAHTQAGIAFVTPGNGGPGTGGSNTPAAPMMATSAGPGGLSLRHPSAFAGPPGQPFIPPQSSSSAGMSMSQGSPLSGGSTGSPGLMSSSTTGAFPKGASYKPSGKFVRPQRVPGKNQFRDEIVIRNADSGKVMGIKGRRIAIIEELSKTIVSFQKVPPGAKERTLTITGATEESIEKAKTLLDQTIRRNASPTRAEGGDEQDDAELYAELALKAGEQDIFGLTCSDPKLLEVAKLALKEYFERRERRSFNSDDGLTKEERKERRKSMPPISQPDAVDLPEMLETLQTETTDTAAKSKLFQSTPNLVQPQPVENGIPAVIPGKRESEPSEVMLQSGAGGSGDSETEADRAKRSAMILERMPKSKMRVVYTREFLLKCANSPLAQVQPAEITHMVSHVEEAVRAVPGKFDPVEYKKAKPAPCPPQAVA